jgi:hypothetical protein
MFRCPPGVVGRFSPTQPFLIELADVTLGERAIFRKTHPLGLPQARREHQQRHPEPLTLKKVIRELQVVRERVEDLEDLRDLDEAITENAGKPLIPWEQAKKDLDLD